MPIIRKLVRSLLGREGSIKKFSEDRAPAPDKERNDVETGEKKIDTDDATAEGEDRRHASEKASNSDEKTRIVPLLARAIFPFPFFEISSADGRREYVNLLTEDLGVAAPWLPYICMMSVVRANERAAIWSASGLALLVALLQAYHHSYKPVYARFYWLTWGQLVGYTGMGVAYEIVPFPYDIVSPLASSLMLGTCILSLMTCHPFTAQITRPRVSEEIAARPAFMKVNYVLTTFWLLLFMVMCISTWLPHGLDLPPGNPTRIILSPVVPIVITLIGTKVSPMIAMYVKRKYGDAGSVTDSNEKGTKDAEVGELSSR